tara:strand:- start:7 stop:159 length:153 start_codon:yes stop_codon:yes gene_type:complete
MEKTKEENRREYMKKYYLKRKKLGYIKVKSKKKKITGLKVERGDFIVKFD